MAAGVAGLGRGPPGGGFGQPPSQLLPTGTTDVQLARHVEEIVRSGLPGLRSYRGRAPRAQLEGYLDRIIEADFPEPGLPVRRPETLRRRIAAYAAATATTASYETIRDAAIVGQHDEPSRSTTQPWRDVLERLWILEPVPAWLPTQSDLNRLVQAPKNHRADPALAAAILGFDEDALLQGLEAGQFIPRSGLLLGWSFESLVTLSLRVHAQAAEAQLRHLRLHGGSREVDLTSNARIDVSSRSR